MKKLKKPIILKNLLLLALNASTTELHFKQILLNASDIFWHFVSKLAYHHISCRNIFTYHDMRELLSYCPPLTWVMSTALGQTRPGSFGRRLPRAEAVLEMATKSAVKCFHRFHLRLKWRESSLSVSSHLSVNPSLESPIELFQASHLWNRSQCKHTARAKTSAWCHKRRLVICLSHVTLQFYNQKRSGTNVKMVNKQTMTRLTRGGVDAGTSLIGRLLDWRCWSYFCLVFCLLQRK